MKGIDVAGAGARGTLELDPTALKIPLGTYQLYLQTQTAGKYQRKPEAAKAAEDAKILAEKTGAEAAAAVKKFADAKAPLAAAAAASGPEAKKPAHAAAAPARLATPRHATRPGAPP